MTDRKTSERDGERRQAIVEAARACFLQFGYAKTSLDDIASRAGISRPLIYRKYPNKEAIFSAVFDQIFSGRYPAVEAALAAPGSKRDKLMRVYEILLIEPWSELSGMPMASEFYEACEQILPEVEARHARARLKYTRAVLQDRELSVLFTLAVDGLESDLPSTALLRRRLHLLVERFLA